MVSKFKRKHAAYVLVVRYLDDVDDITVDAGDSTAHTVYLDLGSSFFRTPDDVDRAVQWAGNLPAWLNDVPINSPVYATAMRVVADAVRDYPPALAIVSAYRARREG
jgi:hypothetical protein